MFCSLFFHNPTRLVSARLGSQRWEKSKLYEWLFGTINTPPSLITTYKHMHILSSLIHTPLIAAESQTCVTAGRMSTDNDYTDTNIGLKCLKADTPLKWKGLWAVWTRPLAKNKERICFSDFHLACVPVKQKKRQLFWWRVKYLRHAAAVLLLHASSMGYGTIWAIVLNCAMYFPHHMLFQRTETE